MKDPGHFDKYNIPFLSEKIKGPICAFWFSLEIQHSVSQG